MNGHTLPTPAGPPATHTERVMSAEPTPVPTPAPKKSLADFWSRYKSILIPALVAALSAAATYLGVPPRVVEVATEVLVQTPAPQPAAADDLPEPPAVKRSYGWQRPPADEVPERVYAAPAALADHLPAKVSLLNAAPVEVPAPLPFDQGQIGSCGPNSAAALLLYTEAKAGKKGQPPPSRLFVYYTTRQLMGTLSQDSGVSNAIMFKALARFGWCDEEVWPYSDDATTFLRRPTQAAVAQAAGRKVTTAEAVPQSLTAMRSCLAQGKPFVYGFSVYPSFETRAVEASGVVPMPRAGERPIGGHDVLIVGYDDRKRAFRFLNSWGDSWGDGGFGWMPYSYATNPALSGDFWTVSESGR